MAIPQMNQLPNSHIQYREWRTTTPPAAGLILIHGLGAHSARWDFLGQYFLKNQVASWAIELSGFGETPGVRGDIQAFEHYYSDILVLHAAVRKQFPSLPLFLVGESMGGLIAVRLMERHPQSWQGLIAISPAFENAMRFGLADYLTIVTMLWVRPQTQIRVPFTAAMCTRDQAYQQIMENSPWELRTASVRLLVLILKEQFLAKINLTKMTRPALFQLAGKDYLVQPAGGVKAFQHLGSPDKKLIHYPDMHHALSIDLDRETVFRDAYAWLKERI